MIVSKDRGFFFIHIPKNGGSSVRDQIQPIDDNQGLFLGTKQHDVLGRYDSSHVPLTWLHEYWPEQFATLETLQGYAVLRDPLDRFASSVTQRFRRFHDKTPTQLSADEIKAEIDTVIDHLTSTDGFPAAQFSHFIRQVDFVSYDGRQMVQNLFHLSEIDLLIQSIAQTSGLDLKSDFHSNKSFELRYKWLNTPVQRTKDVLKRVLAPQYLDVLRKQTIKALAKPQTTSIQSIVSTSHVVQDFVADYYKADQALFDQIPLRRINQST